MAKYYHQSLNRWGPNLSLVFSGNKDLATLEFEEFAVIIKAVKNCKKGKGGMIDTSEWGAVSFVSSLDPSSAITISKSEVVCVLKPHKTFSIHSTEL